MIVFWNLFSFYSSKIPSKIISFIFSKHKEYLLILTATIFSIIPKGKTMSLQKKLSVLFFMIVPFIVTAQEQLKFDDYFIDKTMRVDYFHIGNAGTEILTIDHIYQYGIWAGCRKYLLDNFNNGAYYYKIYDAASGKLIYSKGFDSYFKEYQVSGFEDLRPYHESAIIPFPKNKIKFALDKRDSENKLKEIFSTEIDPANIGIIKDLVKDDEVNVYKPVYNGDPHTKVDIVILGEGYTLDEENKFKKDIDKFTNSFFKYEPYKSMKNDFNIYGVLKPSEESGVDEPSAGIYKNTSLSATFNSLGSERYMLTEDNKAVHDIAAHVPYDAIYIMSNHARYGGGGIYNFFCTFTTDNQFNEYLFVHEFGHSFTGLSDEYYTSATAYDNFYTTKLEPVEPNVTALHDANNIKWKEFVKEGTEIPTPWEKEVYDKMDYAWQKQRTEMNIRTNELKRTGAPKEEIKKAENDYAKADKEHSDKMAEYLNSSKYKGVVGAFEGAGYTPKGLYRPMLDCIMFTKSCDVFCKVCENAIVKVIKHYLE